MSSSMNPLKNFGWFAIIIMVVMLLYPLSLNVASLRGDLVAIDKDILSTKKEINYLQAEIKARANLQQLEEWNELLYGFKSPSAAQFADGEKALANLGGKAENIKPVLVSVKELSNGEAPAGVIGSPFAPLKTNKKPQKKPQKKVEKVAQSEASEAEVPTKIASIDELLDEIDNVQAVQSGSGNEE